MAKKSIFGMGRRKKNRLLEILAVITAGACIVTVVLAGTFVYVSGSIKKNETSITALSNDLTTIQEKVETIKAEESEYKKQLESLQAELSKYEPVVIPDSMKTAAQS